MLPRNRIIVYLFIIAIFLCKSAYAEDSSFVLDFYQDHLSVVDGNRCSMYPSCSNYAYQAFTKHGVLLGWIMSCDRLIRWGRDEAKISNKIVVKGHQLIYDPVAANDFWWFEKDLKK